MGKFFQDRTMWKLSSRGFRKCGTFGSCELFNGSYCCSKSTDFEIFGPSPKIRGVKKKELPQFWVFGYETNISSGQPYELRWIFVSSPKNQNCGSSFFFDTSSDPFFFLKFDLTLTANNSPLKSRTPKKYHIFGNLRTSWWYPGWRIVFEKFETVTPPTPSET